jgi:phospholipase/carboxylesterase
MNIIDHKKIKALEEYSFSDHSKPADLLFVLFHGYGADAYDLVSLKNVLSSSKKRIHWIFPQGVLSVPIGPGWMGRAWWPIDIGALERAMQTGQTRNLNETKPESLENLSQALFQFIEVKGYSWDQVILGGFSQGGMLATELFLKAPKTPKALVSLSGALINKAEWQKAQIKEESSVFISHGVQDPVLPVQDADRIESLFKEKKARVTKVLFQGQHEIPPLVTDQLDTFLKTL